MFNIVYCINISIYQYQNCIFITLSIGRSETQLFGIVSDCIRVGPKVEGLSSDDDEMVL